MTTFTMSDEWVAELSRNDKRMQTTDVALVAFFPKLTDPGAIKREVLLAPDTIDVHAARRAFLAEE